MCIHAFSFLLAKPREPQPLASRAKLSQAKYQSALSVRSYAVIRHPLPKQLYRLQKKCEVLCRRVRYCCFSWQVSK